MLLGYVIIVLSIIILSVYLRGMLLKTPFISESKNWPSVRGVIIKVRKESDAYVHNVGVRYKYDVDGRTYYNDDVNFTLRNWRLDYQEGMSVDVYYRPDDPQTSVLEPGGELSSVRLLPIVIFLGFFIFLLFYLIFLD